MKSEEFQDFFKRATGYDPYPYQVQLALTGKFLPDLINVPTGIGKTAAVILGWLWRRKYHGSDIDRATTPRRLVYCLPMRVLVEQTTDNAIQWLDRLNLLGRNFTIETEGNTGIGKKYSQSFENPDKIVVTTLMGGEDRNEWDIYPERDAIIIGTQDMLLSRALNRGYGMSRYRWPMHFGLLNNDCLWVMDEVQLMGVGLATSVQLAAFRSHIGTMAPMNTKTLWMSATLKKEWLRTVDFNPAKAISTLTLTDDDLANQNVKRRVHAGKILRKCVSGNDVKKLVETIIEHHHHGSRTLVVINTVKRAKEIYSGLKSFLKREPSAPNLVLIHSHFRPMDRAERVRELLTKPGSAGTIIVSTQVIEAGVDVSARTLFTEIAPWSSLVQRFGRCNRYGEEETAEIFWIDLPTGAKSQAPPYSDGDLDESRKILESLEGKSASPHILPSPELPLQIRHVIRKKDIIELFDTTVDLTGHDTDISRFIRESTDTDVSVFWRELPECGPEEKAPLPSRDELCPAPIKDVRDLVNDKKSPLTCWYWDSLEGHWSPINSSLIYPGLSLMLDCNAGHYVPDVGWDIRSKEPVPVISSSQPPANDSYGGQVTSEGDWETIATHSDKVWNEMNRLIQALSLPDTWKKPLLEGVRWHDAGKAHGAFQAMIKPEELKKKSAEYFAAKAPRSAWKHGEITGQNDGRRKYFRHELASGILALLHDKPDLVAYLAAAHHGKVRLSIRSMPDEFLPPDKELRFARGVWDGDTVPQIDLGSGAVMPATTLDLSFMDLGEGNRGPSWLARMLALRDREDLGIFRLAYMEALVKAADERASRGKP